MECLFFVREMSFYFCLQDFLFLSSQGFEINSFFFRGIVIFSLVEILFFWFSGCFWYLGRRFIMISFFLFLLVRLGGFEGFLGEVGKGGVCGKFRVYFGRFFQGVILYGVVYSNVYCLLGCYVLFVCYLRSWSLASYCRLCGMAREVIIMFMWIADSCIQRLFVFILSWQLTSLYFSKFFVGKYLLFGGCF